ncbi:MAG: flagellar motor protein [Ruminiclostridium sp.]|nr:flagellar motor protein [Ruminiclostridium sp.]
MDIGTIIGIIMGMGAILLGYILEGGNPANLIAEVSPFIIVLGGTAGATILSFPMPELMKLPVAMKNLFFNQKNDPVGIINQLAELSEKARKDGLLSLEQDAQNNENELVKKGLALVVDGIETEVIKDILIRETQLHESIHESVAKIFEAAGGFSPTMGVLGTVMGMVHVLGSMDADPSGLGEKIAVAFLATLFGVGFANLVFLPFAGRIKVKAEGEKMTNDLIIEGLLSIQAGENPRIIKEKLNLTLLEKLSGKSKGKKEANVEAEG